MTALLQGIQRNDDGTVTLKISVHPGITTQVVVPLATYHRTPIDKLVEAEGARWARSAAARKLRIADGNNV